MTDPAREYIQMPDGSAVSRPGPQTLWKVVKGANGAPWRLPPSVLHPSKAPECQAAKFCREQNRFYRHWAEEPGDDHAAATA